MQGREECLNHIGKGQKSIYRHDLIAKMLVNQGPILRHIPVPKGSMKQQHFKWVP